MRLIIQPVIFVSVFSLSRLSCACALEMPVNGPGCVVRPFYVHSKEIKQTNEQRHPKLNRRDDIVTCRHGASLNDAASGHLNVPQEKLLFQTS